MRSIFGYIDYRKFLAAYYKKQKEKHRYFSYRYFAQKTGINTPSFLKWIIEGKRNLTRSVTEKYIAAIKFNRREASYFRNLVLFNQAKTTKEKQEYYSVLRSMSENVKESVLNADQFDYFAWWYVPVIRELVTMYDFQGDFKKIASIIRPQILPSDAKAAVNLLLRLKLLKKMDNGTYKQKDPLLVADTTVVSLALQAYTASIIDHSKNALKDIASNERHISGMTMGISPATYSLMAAEIEAFKDRIKIIASKEKKGSVVYQMNISLFPLSGNTDTLGEAKGS
ncbi:MAG: TIGR02147 family protein [Chitinispirillaceae bacterium]|nr:TIGR02147 family protein [Chitinispirillaceae bacterium]